jgi:hypothetical protein
MREAFNKEKKLIIWLTVLQIIIAISLWLKIGMTDPLILKDMSTPILMFSLNELFLLFLFVIKSAHHTGFKAGRTGFILGFVFLVWFQLGFLGETTGENIANLYLMFPLIFLIYFFPAWVIIYLLIKISKKVISK